MSSPDFASIVHVAGFMTGMVLYAMLFVMTARLGTNSRDAVESTDADHSHARLMPYSVAILGLIWNTIALVLYASRDFKLGDPSPWLSALGFSALGFLPAVVVHSAIQPHDLKRAGRVLIAVAYALSAIGAALQFQGASVGVVPSRTGLLTLTAGFAGVLIVLLVTAARDHRNWQRSLFVIALAAFAVSALHLSQPENRSPSWFVELIGHHASLPLVLVILYQDHRFAFADLFLRRALSLVALVTLAVTLHLLLGYGYENGVESLALTMRHITLWVATALAYPFLRDAVGKFVDRVVLNRVDYARVREELNAKLEQASTVDDAVAYATAALARALGASRVTASVDQAAHMQSHTGAFETTREATQLHIPTVDAPFHVIRISDLMGGRRLLSDDQALLEWLAATLARRIDLIRVTSERYDRDLREREILRLATEAELRALRAQLNPHFLFNALTTIGFLLQTSPERALQTLYKLTHLLRAVLRRSAGAFVTLGEEIELVESYLAIESARFEERLKVVMDIPEELRSVRIPPLLLQPLVENAIKHGIAPLARGGSVTVRASLDDTTPGGKSEMITLSVTDNGVGLANKTWKSEEGVGLANIEARLLRYYGDRALFTLTGEPNHGARAQVRVPVIPPVLHEVPLKAAS
ncbi:MAG: histidine kinase [Gemmatimonadaceae bacterium]